MEKLYYIIELNLDGQVRYMIWFTDGKQEVDGIVTVQAADEPRLQCFRNESALRAYAEENKIIIEDEEPARYDLNPVSDWTKQPTENIDCEEFLGAWNLFADVASTLKVKFNGNNREDKVRNRVYDKLFYGNNIYGLTPGGREYFPVWKRKEVRKIAEILKEGFSILRISLWRT